MLYKVCTLLALFAAETADGYVVGMPAATPALHSVSSFRSPAVEMGRGDKRTKKGKRKAGSFGVWRPKNSALRRARDGPQENLGVPKVYPKFEEEPESEPAPELEPVAEVAPEPEPEEVAAPEPEEAAAPVL